jgi:hypothetical protein
MKKERGRVKEKENWNKRGVQRKGGRNLARGDGHVVKRFVVAGAKLLPRRAWKHSRRHQQSSNSNDKGCTTAPGLPVDRMSWYMFIQLQNVAAERWR